MGQIIQILSIAWLACLFVRIWKNLFWKTKHLKTLKPFSCQMCMGFWIGCIYYFRLPILEMIIFASLTSLIATLLHHITSIIGQKNTSI